jgi:hypothetical protein
MQFRMILFTMLVLLSSSVLSVDFTKIGVVVAPNYGKFVIYEGDPGSNNRYSNKIGFQIGIFHEMSIAKKLDLRSEVSFSQRGSVVEFDYLGLGTFKGPTRLHYLDLSPQAVYSLSNRIQITVGPSIGLYLFGNRKFADINVSVGSEEANGREPVEFSDITFPEVGINTGMQIKLSRSWFAGLRYYYGLRSIMKDNEENGLAWKYNATNLQLVFGRHL